ncbi:MAG: hypothetical protein HYV17_07915 [Xanthomonadales bacterium]|nr:hypothetical protein [Xanthomonadales bacterium]
MTHSACALTPEQIAKCAEAQLAYWKASSAIEEARRAFDFQWGYADYGRLPPLNWPDLFSRFSAAQSAAAHFESLISQCEAVGIDREHVMRLRIDLPRSPVQTALDAFRSAHTALLNVLGDAEAAASKKRRGVSRG